MPPWLFGFLAALSIISAFGVILQRNPVHSLLSLVMTLLAIAVLFIGEHAVTVGFLQAIVYVGAIMVLFLFVIWLLNLQTEDRRATGRLALKLFGSLAAAALVAELWIVIGHVPPMVAHKVPPLYGSIGSLADTLFSEYLIAFEVTSLLLLGAVVGAVALARRTPGSGLKSASEARKETQAS